MGWVGSGDCGRDGVRRGWRVGGMAGWGESGDGSVGCG